MHCCHEQRAGHAWVRAVALPILVDDLPRRLWTGRPGQHSCDDDTAEL